MIKIIITITFLFFHISFAQEGKFTQGEKLPAKWEYYQFDFSNDLTFFLPVLKERTEFLAQKLQLDGEEEKFIYRFTYRYKNQLYKFLIATRGIILGSGKKEGAELTSFLEMQIKEVSIALTADGLKGLMDNNPSLTDVTSDMTEVELVPRYFFNRDEFIFFECSGYQKKALRKGQDNIEEIKANLNFITNNLYYNVD